jgi:chromatin segregation and condensation protein Rec8/ScpA/Scc1 (kleisin family)
VERGARFDVLPAKWDGQYELPFDLSKLSLQQLATAFRKVLERAKPDEFEHVPGRPLISMTDMIRRLGAFLVGTATTRFDDLLPEEFTRLDVVWTFLAILEMVRLAICFVTIKEETIWIQNAAN